MILASIDLDVCAQKSDLKDAGRVRVCVRIYAPLRSSSSLLVYRGCIRPAMFDVGNQPTTRPKLQQEVLLILQKSKVVSRLFSYVILITGCNLFQAKVLRISIDL